MTQDQQKQQKKKSKKSKRTGGLGKHRQRKGHSSPDILARAKALNQAHLRGVPSFLFRDPPPWHPPNKPPKETPNA